MPYVRRSNSDHHESILACDGPDVRHNERFTHGLSWTLGYVTPRTLRLVTRLKARLDGLSTITRTEGVTGLFRGTTLALVGVSNGAIQFMAYEKMKRWGFDQRRKQAERAGKTYNQELDKLVGTFVSLMTYLFIFFSLISRIPRCQSQVKL